MRNYVDKEKSQEMVGKAIDFAKDMVDESTKDALNSKIKDIIENIDNKSIVKSLLIGVAIGLSVTIIAYKLINKTLN